jgi:large subunit ribosomal protein L9
VKVDQEGHMYGSVSALDIVHLFEGRGMKLEKRNIALSQPIKTLGEHAIALKLKEGISAAFTLQVVSDIPLPPKPLKEAQEHQEEGSQEEE